MRDEGGPFEFGDQVLISNHRKLLSSKAMVVNVAERREEQERALEFARCEIQRQQRNEYDAVEGAIPDLIRLERYERRAWARHPLSTRGHAAFVVMGDETARRATLCDRKSAGPSGPAHTILKRGFVPRRCDLSFLRRRFFPDEAAKHRGEDWSIARDYVRSRLRRLA
jgi:hypothetical protein